ncbi:hypothetical protein [Xanthomonas sp. 60]
MIRAFRRRPTFLFRLLMLAVVAFGTAGGALASALGELHELSHADHAALTHADHDEAAAHDEEDTGARLLHALAHCGHCHGQGGVLPFPPMDWDVRLASAGVQVRALHRHLPSAGTENLLRPPIQA